MRSEGTYTITVLYGTESRTSETTFTFGGSIVTPGEGTKMAVTGTDFMVNYKITGGKLVSITPDVEAHSLTIAMTASQDGSLVITLPRALIDAKTGDQDDTFFVLVDGEEVDFEEITTSTDRTLTIQFPAGAEEIEIIGTVVVPEFGTIAVMILALAIISITSIQQDAFAQGTGMSISATALDGSDTISVSGHTRSQITDITFTVISPGLNVVSIDQVTPDANGDFATEFKVSPMWKESGFYTIKAEQSPHGSSLYKASLRTMNLDRKSTRL